MVLNHPRLLLMILLAVPWGLCCTKDATPPDTEERPIYVTIFSHNEEPWGSWVGTRDRYAAYRENLVERVGIIREYGAALDWQSDLTVLQAMIREEDDSLCALTEGKNILRYMRDLGVSIDPHSHLTQCSYADIAYWIGQLGVASSGVIGGLPCLECGTTYLGFLDRMDWRAEIDLGADGLIRGQVVPEAVWRPTILSVPAMPGHWFDELSSGVWKPGNGDEFLTHHPEEEIVYVGQGYPHDVTNLGPTQASGAVIYGEDAAYIKELAQKIEQGEIAGDGMLTASIHIRDCETVRDNASLVNVNGALRDMLEILKPMAENGDIVFVTYPRVVQIWQDEYAAQPSRVDFSSFSMYEAVKVQAMAHCGAGLGGADRDLNAPGSR
ncbi:MAG: hypothetical protein MUE60_04330 [Candidatus Eisenbacteria bacterium]|nr:hypothetical protein [Candidatus Eisenbacteria bacterium]